VGSRVHRISGVRTRAVTRYTAYVGSLLAIAPYRVEEVDGVGGEKLVEIADVDVQLDRIEHDLGTHDLRRRSCAAGKRST